MKEKEKHLFYKDIDKVLLIIKSANEDGNMDNRVIPGSYDLAL